MELQLLCLCVCETACWEAERAEAQRPLIDLNCCAQHCEMCGPTSRRACPLSKSYKYMYRTHAKGCKTHNLCRIYIKCQKLYKTSVISASHCNNIFLPPSNHTCGKVWGRQRDSAGSRATGTDRRTLCVHHDATVWSQRIPGKFGRYFW